MSHSSIAANTVRFLAVDGVEKAKSGHPGAPMGLADIATELFTRHLRYIPSDPKWPNRDRFVLSCGHASMLLYSLLHMAGYEVEKDDLAAFRQWGSKTPGHPEVHETPGVETTTGPLGQGVGNAVGMALASKLLGARFNTTDSKLIDYRVYCLASDGDMMEGISSEATSLAGHWGLDNLIIIYDDNKITIDGSTELSFSEDVGKRFEAYGFGVWHVNGQDTAQLAKALEAAKSDGQRPSLIVARTTIGFGAPHKQGTSGVHGTPLGPDEAKAAKEALGWPLEPAFYTPEEAYQPFKQQVARTQKEYDAWQNAAKQLSGEKAQLWRSFQDNTIPKDLLAQVVAALEPQKDATRASAAKAEQIVAKLVPQMIGGCADLAASTKTTIKGSGDIARGQFDGRNINFGIREHGMGAIVNGLSLSGVLPFASTFLIFSDYMRPSMRLAAIMKQQVVYAFTHDSIFVGEDGPTHEPIEQLNSLRLIPNLHVFRPADTMEAAAAWSYGVIRKDGPTALALTRQGLPVLERPQGFSPESILKGAYLLSDAKDPTVVLIATGSEVQLAVGAKPLLEAKGERVRVVSMPCVEAFLALPKAEQDAILGTSGLRVSIECGSTALWRAIVGQAGLTLGIDRFGASAPYERLAQEFGFTAEHVCERVLAARA